MAFLITIGLIVLTGRAFVRAILDDRPVKAIGFAVLSAWLIVMILHGMTVGIGSGVELDTN